ncbi:Protein IWS1-like protein [Armadillidium nasatum]|uniref:Protein IWS1-like protein n=1 Tax=Armadillidium nasatum TaxID=96803 RepID=A0A5N5T552_9CRUS|nr:Protein IWS1-like protein [Armadillidium nasatum]
MMMARKKEENSRRRKRNNVDIINDNEELIASIVRKMRIAADEDRQLNLQHKPATKKISMMEMAMGQLKKYDLVEGFLDANVLTALTDWLAPMPDKSLPSTKIREAVLKWLGGLPPLNQEMLKTSGIGKAVMYLYKHPKEQKSNKDRCGRLIATWSRPIFNNSDDFKTLTKEERMMRDHELSRNSGVTRRDGQQTDEQGQTLRPGDPGWCYRARVPLPSTKDYVNRPKWQKDTDISKGNRKQTSRLDKQLRAFKEKQKQAKARRAIKISVEGRNMAL